MIINFLLGLLGLSHLRLKDDSLADEILNDSLDDSIKSSVTLNSEKEEKENLMHNEENLMDERFNNPESPLVNEWKGCAEDNKLQDHSTIHNIVFSGCDLREQGDDGDREDSKGHLYSKHTNEDLKREESVFESQIKHLVNREEGHSENTNRRQDSQMNVRRSVIHGDKIISNSNKYNNNPENLRSSKTTFDKIESFNNQTNRLPKKTSFDHSEGASHTKGVTAQDNTRDLLKGKRKL